ncbi:Oidioi.mRNA.OKI2018_I69.PAR.g9232.t1.cds [Oikopleura dioica]|uniref:Oidioi.mRNA.OKI2018_I69.PAR.g9232.t1.cds n=1 Tax=Oikopleura dioica TaxID=34765 RepID=A0ABN7RNV1_OIKDI|nr:Oidioi.mRNA.OKI2018_I69.PAR.g9232.t1.cds [Oikopleura dioica]
MSSAGTPGELTQKEALVTQILELQNTLEDLSQRVESVRDENIRLRSENEVLGKYIEQLMAASPVFHSSTSKSKN